MPETPTYLRQNLADWERAAEWYERHNAVALRKYGGRAWGVWRIPENELRLLGPVRGRSVLELGCGAATWSIALARGGARVVGLDFSPARLRQARKALQAARIDFPLVRANGERIPFPNEFFDIVLSDHGATAFTDPYRTVPEVARVLRVGGSFVIAHASPIASLALNIRSDRLERRFRRDYFDLHSIRFPHSVNFQLPYGEWIRLFGSVGLVVNRLVEPRAPTGWKSSYVSRSDQRWARHWPAESIWKVTKVIGPARRASRVSTSRPSERKGPRNRMA